jgi:hypothetical protein
MGKGNESKERERERERETGLRGMRRGENRRGVDLFNVFTRR